MRLLLLVVALSGLVGIGALKGTPGSLALPPGSPGSGGVVVIDAHLVKAYRAAGHEYQLPALHGLPVPKALDDDVPDSPT